MSDSYFFYFHDHDFLFLPASFPKQLKDNQVPEDILLFLCGSEETPSDLKEPSERDFSVQEETWLPRHLLCGIASDLPFGAKGKTKDRGEREVQGNCRVRNGNICSCLLHTVASACDMSLYKLTPHTHTLVNSPT